MKKYYWIMDCRDGDLFDRKLPEGTTRKEAIVTAACEWDRLTAHDKRHRDYFELVYAPEDDYGCCDLDKSEAVTTFC